MNIVNQKDSNNVVDKNHEKISYSSPSLTDVDNKRDQSRVGQSSELARPKRREVRVLSFTSGKGGVGKTHIVVNLAYALQQLGARVMVLDADFGLANVDVLLGLTPPFNLQHVLEGQKALSDILLQGPAGMTVLPASAGVCEVARLNEANRFRLLDALDDLHDDFDYVLVDTGAGISNNVIYFNLAAPGYCRRGDPGAHVVDGRLCAHEGVG